MNKAIILRVMSYFSLLVIIAALFFGALAYIQSLSKQQEDGLSIGTSFTLTNEDNIRVSSNDFKTDYLLVFFGFTNCYGVCPVGMDNITKALEMLDPKLLNNLTPLFITIDPERDDPEAIKEFLSSYHNNFVGLTGSDIEVQAVIKAFGVYSSKAEASDKGEYQVDHSAYIYLTKRDGSYVSHSFYNVETSELVKFFQEYLG
ncbi:MAG: SCO family protein [Rickettsiales bacterium]|jgi:protein SCO1|nr:SCO family protein [Rickettsiales bacterium]